jgi:hypothetical protein
MSGTGATLCTQTWAKAENRRLAGDGPYQIISRDIYLKEELHRRYAWCAGSKLGKGGTDMKGLFNQDGFEVVIWIIVIIFLLSIFFDEGID